VIEVPGLKTIALTPRRYARLALPLMFKHGKRSTISRPFCGLR
jgi:hypothetical protein